MSFGNPIVMRNEKRDEQLSSGNRFRAGASQQAQREGEEEINFREVLRTLSRRKGVLIASIVSITGLASLVVSQLDPYYTADSLLMIENRSTQVVEMDTVVPTLTVDTATIETQAEVLRSRSLAATVIKHLGLLRDPEFNRDLPRGEQNLIQTLIGSSRSMAAETVEQFRSMAGEMIQDWGFRGNPEFDPDLLHGIDEEIRVQGPEPLRKNGYLSALYVPAEQDVLPAAGGLMLDRVVETFLASLEIVPVGDAHVLQVGFQSEDPVKAARITNQLVENYIENQRQAKLEATRQATTWLENHLERLGRELIELENVIEAYRAEKGMVQTKGTTVTDQQLAEVSSQLITARAHRAEMEAREQQLNRLVKQGNVESTFEVLNSSLIQRLRIEEIELLRQKADLSIGYGEKHPTMINLHAEIKDLRNKIKHEVDKIARGLANEVEVARARERMLQTSLKNFEDRVLNLDRSSVELRELERDAESTQLVYEGLLIRHKEILEQTDMLEPDAQIISKATIPTVPTFPRPFRTVAIAFVGSIFLGVVIIFLLEKTTTGFRGSVELERASGLPVLGFLPTMKDLQKPRTGDLKSILNQPAFGEALRTICTSFELIGRRGNTKTVLVNAALPKEGKSVFAASLACQVALSGQKCLLIDCDFRRPRIHEFFDIEREPGLVDWWLREPKFEDILHSDKGSGVMIIPSGVSASVGARDKNLKARAKLMTFLGSERFKQLLVTASEVYDLIILDSPPVMVVSDARILGRVVDETIFVVRWGETRREVALSGLHHLQQEGANVIGVVLSQVDVSKYERYSFPDSHLYSRAYQSYY